MENPQKAAFLTSVTPAQMTASPQMQRGVLLQSTVQRLLTLAPPMTTISHAAVAKLDSASREDQRV